MPLTRLTHRQLMPLNVSTLKVNDPLPNVNRRPLAIFYMAIILCANTLWLSDLPSEQEQFYQAFHALLHVYRYISTVQLPRLCAVSMRVYLVVTLLPLSLPSSLLQLVSAPSQTTVQPPTRRNWQRPNNKRQNLVRYHIEQKKYDISGLRCASIKRGSLYILYMCIYIYQGISYMLFRKKWSTLYHCVRQ